MSRAEYDVMLEKTYAPENAEALKSALGKLDERRNEANIPEKPTEYYAVRQVSERRYAVCSISADGLVTTAKPNITSITEAKKAMLEIFELKKNSVKVEFVHPQTLDEISAKMYNDRAQEKLPDIMYRININSDKKSADTHVLQEYVKNDEGKYSVGQEVAKGDYEKCNKFLAQLMSAPKIETPVQKYEIYQLKSGDDMYDFRFVSYELITKNGSKPDFANYDKVYEGNAAEFDGKLGERLDAIYEKFNLDHPEDFKGHSLSVSDVVVLDDKAYYVDDVGFKPLEDFIPLEVKQSRFYDELPKRLSDIAEGKISPLQDNLLKVGNDALRLNVPPYIMREAVFRSDDERVQKLADTYEKMCERKHSAPDHNKSKPEEHKQRKPRMWLRQFRSARKSGNCYYVSLSVIPIVL